MEDWKKEMLEQMAKEKEESNTLMTWMIPVVVSLIASILVTYLMK